MELIKRTFSKWQADKGSRLAAALTFFAILSIPPLMILTVTLVGRFAGEAAVQQQIMQQAEQWVGGEASAAIATILETATTQPANLSLATGVNLAILLFAASAVFVQLQDAMNSIWRVTSDPDGGIMNTVSKRVTSFFMVLVVGVLFLILLLATSVVAFLGNIIEEVMPGSLPILRILNGLLGLGLLTGVFGLIYKTIPDVVIAWRDVWLGAAVTAVLFMLGVLGLGLYFQYTDLTSTYGAAGSLIALMLWIYFSAQIFFLGAEFTQVQANLYGASIRPEEGAVRVETITQPNKA